MDRRPFDPNGAGLRNGRFAGLPTRPEDAQVVLVPVPWDVTVSAGDGTREGPRAILEASPQIECLDPRRQTVWTSLAMLDLPADLLALGSRTRPAALRVIDWLEDGATPDATGEVDAARNAVNQACADMVHAVESRCGDWLDRGRRVGVIGGDHSTALGLYRAVSRRFGGFGLLHLDAHCDLRAAYEGFTFSHASIARNALDEQLAERIVQVGVRDYCAEELDLARASDGRVRLYDRRNLVRRAAEGEPWAATVREIVATLPPVVVVSLDVDVLDLACCPNSGTPVPGGLDYEQCFYLIEAVVDSGRSIIGFDLTEVAPGPGDSGPDALVGARAAYRLAALAAASPGAGQALGAGSW